MASTLIKSQKSSLTQLTNLTKISLLCSSLLTVIGLGGLISRSSFVRDPKSMTFLGFTMGGVVGLVHLTFVEGKEETIDLLLINFI